MWRLIALALMLPGLALGQATTVYSTKLPARLAPSRGLEIKPFGPLGTVPTLHIEDSVLEPSCADGNALEVIAQGINNNPKGRTIFNVQRCGGVGVYDYLIVMPPNAGGVPAMLSIGSDLGPSGATLALMNNYQQNHDLLWATDSGGSGGYPGTRRLTLASTGLLAFGDKTASFPALRANGAALEVRLGDNSDRATILASGANFTAGVYVAGLLLAANAGEISNAADIPTVVKGGQATSGSAVGVVTDTLHALTTAGDRLLSNRNNGSEVVGIGKDGDMKTSSLSFLDDSGTTGNRTVNLPNGRNAFGAGASTITITNSLVTATSRVFVVLQTNDATAILKNVVPGSGSFVVNLTATATGTTKFGWYIIN